MSLLEVKCVFVYYTPVLVTFHVCQCILMMPVDPVSLFNDLVAAHESFAQPVVLQNIWYVCKTCTQESILDINEGKCNGATIVAVTSNIPQSCTYLTIFRLSSLQVKGLLPTE